jgi:hypothetical protein
LKTRLFGLALIRRIIWARVLGIGDLITVPVENLLGQRIAGRSISSKCDRPGDRSRQSEDHEQERNDAREPE